MPESPRCRVAALVVTWNRRELLEESLRAILSQNPAPDHVIVVDNASTDGTSEMVTERFGGVQLITSAENTGGAGGFALGIAAALETNCDVIWLMDDDTVAEPDALAAMLKARSEYRPGPAESLTLAPPALIASRVEWTDGRPHPMNTPREKLGAGSHERLAAAKVGCVPIRTASFVSILISAARVREVGLPVADYFLWNDDFEYSGRIIRGYRGLLCPASRVIHKTKLFAGANLDPGPRFYYEVRNKVWTFGRSKSLSPTEKFIYGGFTATQWVRTFVQSSDRSVLRSGLMRGLAHGLLKRPRDTGDVVRAAAPSQLPRAFERSRGSE